MTDDEREFYMHRRQCLIMELGALEDLLGMARSIVPKRKRERFAPPGIRYGVSSRDEDGTEHITFIE